MRMKYTCCDHQNSRKNACNRLHPVIGTCKDREPYPQTRAVRGAVVIRLCVHSIFSLIHKPALKIFPILYHYQITKWYNMRFCTKLRFCTVQYGVLYQINLVPLFSGPHKDEQNWLNHYYILKKNLNASRPSEHPPVRWGKCQDVQVGS